MSNQKFKNENYNNLGGINSKFSQYQTGPLEFLDIKNFDFQTPGSLTQRWGSTQYVSQTFGSPISALYEYSKLDGSSYVLVGHTGGLWFGATTGNSQGMSFTSTGTTLVGGATAIAKCSIFQLRYSTLGANFVVLGFPVFYQGATATGTFFTDDSKFILNINPIQNTSNKMSFQTINNYLFGADGTKFFKFDGATTTPIGLPPPVAIPDTVGISTFTAGDSLVVGVFGGTAGSFSFFASYVNNRGFESQIWPLAAIEANFGTTLMPTNNILFANINLLTPSRYGISTINIYSYYSTLGVQSLSPTDLWNPNYVLTAKYAVAGETTSVRLGTTLGGVSSLINNLGKSPNPIVNNYFPFGMTLAVSSTLGTGAISNVNITSYNPRFLEVYSNRLFAAGFSSTPSTVWFSGLAEPEGFAPSANFEVRTNDSDFITCMKAYQTRLYLFKRESLHSLYGDSPENFYLQQVSGVYGTLNNDCALVYENTLVFLDRKGVFLFNGSSVECLSDKIQPIFDRMNYSSAVDTAKMVHDKLRSQILVCIPVDSSTTNNITLAYDYIAKAWTTQDGYSPTVFAKIQGRNNLKNVFYGTPSGVVNWFGPSFLSDNGTGFTTSFKTRFIHDLGDSTQKQVRRLYIDADSGTTFSIPIKFYQDNGTSIVYSTTMTLGTFQDRIDFGISCKSIAFEIFNMQANSPLRINGFTVESRMQRRV